jgi:hypothetical protein
MSDPVAEIERKAVALNVDLTDERFAQRLDENDELRSFRSQYV